MGRYLETRGHTWFDWTNDPGFSDPGKLDPKRSATLDLDALYACDAFLYYITHRPSRGAPAEALAAFVLNKPVFALWDSLPDENHIYTYLYEWVDTIEGFADQLDILARSQL